MNKDLEALLSFTALLNRFRGVKRITYIPGTNEYENDVEHSYHLAMLAWFIASTQKIDFDMEKLLQYALVHDLVEAYAGDTYLYSQDQDLHDSKHEREKEAAARIASEFPSFSELHETIASYEKREDKESRFVYVLDKIHPVLQAYLDGGAIWKEESITLDMLLEKKSDKVKLSEELTPYWDEFVTLLKDKESVLFP